MSADNPYKLSGKSSTSDEGQEGVETRQWKHDCAECPKGMIRVTPETESLQQDKATLCQNKYQMEMQQTMSRCPQVAGEPQQLNSGEVTIFHPCS